MSRILRNLTASIQQDRTMGYNMVNVCRDDIFGSAERAFSRRSFNPKQRLSVIFIDQYAEAEGAVDHGGPTREFLRLLMQEIISSNLLEGPESARMISLDSHG